MNVEILQNVRNKVHVVTKCNFWFFSWQSPGRPCRRPFDGGLAMQLKQAPPFMGRWNTLWTWPFIIRAPVNQRTNFIDRLLFAKHFVTQFWNILWCQKMFPSLGQQSWPSLDKSPRWKIANSWPDIWWCPWDKGGAVIYVIGGTHPPIWLPIDINHHQISNGHAFPSAMNINLFQNLLLNLCVCQNAPVGFREAEERQFVRARGPPHFTDTGQGAPPETDGRPPSLHSMAWPSFRKTSKWEYGE